MLGCTAALVGAGDAGALTAPPSRARRGWRARSPASQPVAGALGLLGGAAAAQAEQPLGEQQVDDHGEVDEKADDLQHGVCLLTIS